MATDSRDPESWQGIDVCTLGMFIIGMSLCLPIPIDKT